MKAITANKPMLILKIGLLSAFIILSNDAFARCYGDNYRCPVVECRYKCYKPCYQQKCYKPCYQTCYQPVYYQPTYIYIRSTAPYRHNERSEYQMPEYAFIE